MIVFDVGANDGYHSRLSGESGYETYSFEPVPNMFNLLCERVKDYSNVHTFQLAISDKEGVFDFNVVGHCDWGCSSLYEFNSNLEKTWPGMTIYSFGEYKQMVWEVTEKIKVRTIRVDTFMEDNNIPYIDFLHCDAQGHDIKVLHSFGNRIKDLKEGRVEVTSKNPLYKNSINTLENLETFLEKNGFEIKSCHPNDSYGNEVNVHFIRKLL